jgi:hypothetical protein
MCIQLERILTEQVPKINNRLRNINNGGCGYFALEMHKALAKKGIKAKIVLMRHDSFWGGNYTEQRVQERITMYGGKGLNTSYQKALKLKVQKRNGINLWNAHICVEVDGKFYDADGEFHGSAISKHLTIKTMELWLSIKSEWNSSFKEDNRGKLVTDVFERFFTIAFKNLK